MIGPTGRFRRSQGNARSSRCRPLKTGAPSSRCAQRASVAVVFDSANQSPPDATPFQRWAGISASAVFAPGWISMKSRRTFRDFPTLGGDRGLKGSRHVLRRVLSSIRKTYVMPLIGLAEGCAIPEMLQLQIKITVQSVVRNKRRRTHRRPESP